MFRDDICLDFSVPHSLIVAPLLVNQPRNDSTLRSRRALCEGPEYVQVAWPQ